MCGISPFLPGWFVSYISFAQLQSQSCSAFHHLSNTGVFILSICSYVVKGNCHLTQNPMCFSFASYVKPLSSLSAFWVLHCALCRHCFMHRCVCSLLLRCLHAAYSFLFCWLLIQPTSTVSTFLIANEGRSLKFPGVAAHDHYPMLSCRHFDAGALPLPARVCQQN